GWTNGYKEEMAFLAPALNSLGYAFISASYRLAPRNTFPMNRDDVADAIKLSVELAPSYGYSPEALFIGGHSAGAHLTTLLALSNDWKTRRSLPLDVIKGCLALSGVYDFTPGSGLSMRPRFLGTTIPDNEVHASPIFQIETVATPFLVSYGSNDFPHLIVQAKKFAMVYRAKGGSVHPLELPDCDHVSILVKAARADEPWLGAADEWMESIMRPPA